MSSYAGLLHQAMLRHQPQRHALMLPQGHPTKKYDDRRGTIGPAQLVRHLAGEITLAAPAAHADMAAVLPLDVDSGGLATLYALLDAAKARGLWAWAEFHPRDGWTDEEQRGYAWVAFDRVVPAAQLQQLGHELIAEADLPEASRQAIEVRAHHADTRLPFATHTHTGRRGHLFFVAPEETYIDLNENWEGGLASWASAYHPNDARVLPEVAPLPLAAPRPARQYSQRQFSTQEIKAAFNAQADLGAILQAADGRRISDRLYRCPCGQHQNGDARPSLQLKAARKMEYGALVANGLSPSCRFAGQPGRCWDAFNVYMMLHGLSFEDMLAHARAVTGLHDALERPRSAEAAQTRGNTLPQAASVSQQANERPAYIAETPTSAQAVRATVRGWLAGATISPTSRRIMSYLLDQAASHQATWCKRTVPTIAEAARTTERTAQRLIRRLQRLGVLAVQTTHSHRANIYRLTLPGDGLVQGHPPLATQEPNLKGTLCPVQDHSPITTQHSAAPGGGGHDGHPCILRLVRGGDPGAVQADAVPAGDQAKDEAPAPSQFKAPEPVQPEIETHQADACPPDKPVPVAEEPEEGAGAVFTPLPEGMYLRQDGTMAACGLPSWSERDPKELEIRRRRREMVQASEGAMPLPPTPATARVAAVPAQLALGLEVRPQGRPQVGAQALQAELARIEREARRCFAIGAPQAGRRYQARAGTLREQLAVQGVVIEPARSGRRQRGRQPTTIGLLV